MLQSNFKLGNFDEYINLLIQKEMQHKEVEGCPYCKSTKVIKYGKYLGVQRFKCKECKRTFSLSTKTVWQYTKKSYKTWIKFVELLVEKQTLRYCANKLDINLSTAFYWRHKILNAINSIEDSKVLKNEIHISKTLLKENFKGSRKISTEERKKIFIIGSIDTRDTMIAVKLCKDIWNYKVFNEKVYKRIDKDSFMVPYGDRYLIKVARDHNKNKFEECAEEKRIKYFSKLLHLWLVSFRGIATKYLDVYLSWFILENLKKKISWIELLNFISKLMTYVKTEDISNTYI